MFVVVDAGADSGVILVPLTSLDLTVTVPVTEVCEELEEDLVFSHFTALYLGVHAAVVYASEVGGSDLARTISVELEESLVDHGLSSIVQGSLYSQIQVSSCHKFEFASVSACNLFGHNL